jgi:predicted AAA+ superfamily ATPase
MFAAELAASGVPGGSIVEINLEDPAYADLLGDYRALYDHIRARLAPSGPTYVFIDEIQNAHQFERVVDGLFIIPGVDLYVTGSSSRPLSGSLASLLSGRYVELGLLPLSFAEYVGWRGGQAPARDLPLRDLYDDYVRFGAFPFVTRLNDDDQVRQYLDGIVNTVLLRDVATHQRVSNVAQLRSLTQYMADTIGSATSVKRIADAMTSAGRAISRPTVENYLTGLTDALVLYPAKRWDVRGKRILAGGDKYYLVDVGVRRALLGARPVDTGHILENIVYLELLRRPGRVHTGTIDRHEVDFVVEDGSGTTYIQVAASVDAPETLDRELAPLRAIPDFNPRVLLTLDREPPQSYDGIRRMSVLDWLLT